MSKKKKNVFDDPKFIEAWTEMVLEGWHGWLEGRSFPKAPKEIYFCHSNEKELQDLCNAFEKKYNRKLKYRIVNLSYISYLETEVGEKYEEHDTC